MDPYRGNLRPLAAMAALIAATALLTLSACGPSPQIQEIDGVIHVMNPAEPLRPDMQVTMEQVLLIGREEGEEMEMLPDVASLDADEQYLYLLVRQDDQVRVYDHEGGFVRTIGKHGQGPGELNVAATAALGPGGNLWVANMMAQAMSVFTPQGEFVENIRFSGIPPMLVRVTQEGFMGLHLEQRQSPSDPMMVQTKYHLRRFDTRGDTLGTVFTSELEMDLRDMQLGSTQEKVPVYCVDGEGQIWQTRARTDAYEINVYSPEGELVRVVEKEFEGIPKSEGEIQEEKEFVERIIQQQLQGQQLPPGMSLDYEPPTHRPATGMPYFDPRGYVWVQTYLPGSSDPNVFDIFDTEGTYLTQVVIEGREIPSWLTFRGEIMYVAESSPEQLPAVYGYRVRYAGQ